jgi:hypothetical protein
MERISRLNKDNFVMARRYSPGSKAKMYSAKVSQIQENPISDFSSIKF